MKLQATKIGSTIHIYDDPSSEDVNNEIEREMIRTGRSRIDGGIATWIEDSAVVDLNQDASSQYTWDKAGNKVKHQRLRVTKSKRGVIAKQFVKYVYKTL